MIKNFINLTNGIEAVELFRLKEYSFIRIQSTACEQKRWEFILQELDYNFLMNLVVGNECILYDFSAKRKTPRAIWQGLEWIKFVLYKIWFKRDYNVDSRMKGYFEETYKQLTNSIKIRLKYFRKFMLADDIYVCYKGGRTSWDNGNYKEYVRILKGG